MTMSVITNVVSYLGLLQSLSDPLLPPACQVAEAKARKKLKAVRAHQKLSRKADQVTTSVMTTLDCISDEPQGGPGAGRGRHWLAWSRSVGRGRHWLAWSRSV